MNQNIRFLNIVSNLAILIQIIAVMCIDLVQSTTVGEDGGPFLHVSQINGLVGGGGIEARLFKIWQ